MSGSQQSTWLKYANLQMASEAFLDRYLSGAISFQEALIRGNGHSSTFTSTQAAEFAAQYKVIAHLPNTRSGFSGTLFQDNDTKKYTLSFRSTEFVEDVIADSVGTNEGISQYGWAFGQIADMEQWWKILKAANPDLLTQGVTVTGYSLGGHLATAFAQLRAEENGGVPPTYLQHIYTFNGAGTGGINSGHSLTDVMQLFVDVWKKGDEPAWLVGSDPETATRRNSIIAEANANLLKIRNETATIAGYVSGIDGDGTSPVVPRPGYFDDFRFQYAMAVAGRWTTGAATWENTNFSAVFDSAKAATGGMQFDGLMSELLGSGMSAVAIGGLRHTGSRTEIEIEDQPLVRGLPGRGIPIPAPRLTNQYGLNDFGDTHSLVLIIDSLAMMDVFARLSTDPGKIDNAFAARLINAASASHRETMPGGQGKAEGDSLEYLVDALHELIVGTDSILHTNPKLNEGGTWADGVLRTAFYQKIDAINAKINEGGLAGTMDVVSQADKTASELRTAAANPDGIATRYALRELNPFALLGADYGRFNANGELDLYSTETGAGALSREWIADRAALLSWKSQWNLANGRPAAATQVKAPWVFIDQTENTRYELSPNGSSFARFNQVVFGSDAGNGIAGDLLADRLYGMDGDDSLSGAAGPDYLEGNAGADSLDGGNGNDTLLGGVNDDILVGGRGADWLVGGKDFDRYRFSAGDGLDVIDDFDGSGLINIDGTVLAGGKPAGPNLWESPDKSVRYALVDQGDGTKTLNILYGGDRIQVLRFTDGMLGIHLRGADPVPPPPPRDRLVLGDFLPQTPPALDDLGNPVLTATPAPGRADALQDGSGNDSVSAGGGDDAVSALRGGDDRIDAGDGSDVVLAGAGADWVAGGEGPDVLGGGVGDDRLFALGEVDFSDAVVSGETQAPSIGKGDFLDGGDASDTLVGDAGPDALLGGAGGDMISGGGGDDFLAGDGQAAGVGRTWSTTRNVEGDRYTWTAVGFSVTGTGTGNDILAGGAGADWIFAGAGNDWADGGSDADVVFGEAGSDEIFGGAGNDVLSGDGPVAQLSAELHGNDFVEGGAGDDTLFGGQGSDNLFGRSGNDILVGDGGERTAAGGGMASGRGALGRGCGRVASSRISPSWVGRSSSTVLREKTHQRIPPFQCRKRHMDRRPGLRAMAVTRAAPDKANRVQRFLADGPFPALTGRWGTSRH